MNTKGGWVFILILSIIVAGFFCIQKIEAIELVNINTASLEELDTLPEIGLVKAQEIINYRLSSGPFLVIEDIMKVSGIKSATFEKIKDLITVGEITSVSECGNGVLETDETC